MRKIYLSMFIFFVCLQLDVRAQMNIGTDGFYINNGSVVSVTGDLKAATSVSGVGHIVLNGTSDQQIDFSAHTVPFLEIIKPSGNVNLLTDIGIDSNLILTSGILNLNNFNLTLGGITSITGGGESAYLNTSGTGVIKKRVTSDMNDYFVPMGDSTGYRPATITVSGATYSNGNLNVSVSGAVSSANPPMLANKLNAHWVIAKSGITGGLITLKAFYAPATDIFGDENKLAGYYYNGTDWTSAGETHDYTANTIAVPVVSDSGVVTAFNRFVAAGVRVFLQGAYSSTTGLMADNLRALPFGPSSSKGNFPADDPYRQADYSALFTHVNNTISEYIPTGSVLAAQANANDNIVDWVFLELRNLNASPGNVILQTRSALVQRDGDVVDVDGHSPVTFNDIPAGNYTVAVRHRNHLGISFTTAAFRQLTETQTLAYNTGHMFDFTTAVTGDIYGNGTNFTTASHPVNGTVNLLYAGNVNGNTTVRYQGPGNDRISLITDLSNNEITVLTGYYRGDLNLNRTVRFQGPSNDRAFLLSVLTASEIAVKQQSLLQ